MKPVSDLAADMELHAINARAHAENLDSLVERSKRPPDDAANAWKRAESMAQIAEFLKAIERGDAK